MHRRGRAGIIAVVAVVGAVLEAVAPTGVGAEVNSPHSTDSDAPVTLLVELGPSAEPTLPAAVDRATDGLVTDLPRSGAIAIEVQPDQVHSTMTRLAAIGGVASVAVDPPVSALGIIPNDPGWPRQTSRRDVRFDSAWQSGTGTGDTVIAVIDTGVSPSPELTGRLVPGVNLVPRGSPAPWGDNNDTSDGNGHGTAVAIIAAGAGNDSYGVAGGCWQCRVMPVRVLDDAGSGSLSTVAEGVYWAIDHGADVINLSLGGTSNASYLDDAIAAAAAADVVVVAAAGNDGTTDLHYPAAVPDVIAVAGTAGYSPPTVDYRSTRGAGWVDVAAPFCNHDDDSSSLFCGTSSASPVVAGLVGLMRSDRPDLTATAIRQALESSAIEAFPAGSVAAGAVRADAAVAAAMAAGGSTTQVAAPSPPDTTPPVLAIDAGAGWRGGMVTTNVRTSDASGVREVQFFLDGRFLVATAPGVDGVARFTWDTAEATDGFHVLRVVGVDGAGNLGAAQALTAVDNGAPVVRISGPPSGAVVHGRFLVSVQSTDGSGIRATLVASDGRWIAGSSGEAPVLVSVPVSRSGGIGVVAITVDAAGHASFSNVVSVTAKVATVRGGRSRR